MLPPHSTDSTHVRFKLRSGTLLSVVLILLAVAPSAWLAWNWRSMPQLGFYHDDSIHWVSAKALADGSGYRIASLPGQPWQTKYPPVFSGLLALVWKLGPAFPFNLPWASLVAWLAFPAYILLVRAVLRQMGLGPVETWVLTLAAAWSPFAILLSISLMPELLFMTLFLGCILVAERALKAESPAWLAAVAGLLGGIAYLTKSAALPLLLTAPLCFALRKQFRRALLFAAAMLPAVAGWQLWVLTHASRSHDLVTLYYTNYVGFQTYNVTWPDLPRVLWYNLDGFFHSIGKLLLFDAAVDESVLLERIVAFAAIAGVVRLTRRIGLSQYALAALGITALLLIWHYPPDRRFIFPLYPLLAAGLWLELRNFAGALRRAWNQRVVGQRIAAGVGAAALAGLAAFIAFAYVRGNTAFLPSLLADHTTDLRERRQVYSWISEHTPAGATMYAYDDPLLYLYTGRRACSLPIPTRLYYRDDNPGIDQLLHTLPSFSRGQHLDYILWTKRDFYRGPDEGARASREATGSSPLFERVYRSPDAEVFQRVP
jgi:hypothetical protein